MEGEISTENDVVKETCEPKSSEEPSTGPEMKMAEEQEREALCEIARDDDDDRDANYNQLPGCSKFFQEELEGEEDDYHLPEGWSRKIVQRQSGKSAGKYDVYIYSPSGKKFRSRLEIQRYLDEMGSALRLEQFDFRVRGQEHNAVKARYFAVRTSCGQPLDMSVQPDMSVTSPSSGPAKVPKKKRKSALSADIYKKNKWAVCQDAKQAKSGAGPKFKPRLVVKMNFSSLKNKEMVVKKRRRRKKKQVEDENVQKPTEQEDSTDLRNKEAEEHREAEEEVREKSTSCDAEQAQVELCTPVEGAGCVPVAGEPEMQDSAVSSKDR